jgi:hypothetical protein
MMIPINSLRAGLLGEAQPGDFYFPREQGRERFLVGRINDVKSTMAVMLEGKRPFYAQALEVWDGRRGLIVSNYNILVDHTTSRRIDANQDLRPGSLIMDGVEVSILATTQNNYKYSVSLNGTGAHPSDRAAAFTRWKLVAVDGEGEVTELFSFG